MYTKISTRCLTLLVLSNGRVVEKFRFFGSLLITLKLFVKMIKFATDIHPQMFAK